MADCSSTPLIRKLGLKTTDTILLINEPADYAQLIGLDPGNLKNTSLPDKDHADFIHFFTSEMAELEVMTDQLKQKLIKGGSLWLSWPKGTSKLTKDLNGNDVRRVGLQTGLVDVKVCAVDSDWSAIKFMFRKNDR